MRGGIGIVAAGLLAAAWAGLPALAQAPAADAPSATPSRTAPAASPAAGEMRELIDAAKATAKAARENVDHARVVPDILTQILAKLDKLENKLDKIENAVKANGKGRR